jgi:hypothetical protein
MPPTPPSENFLQQIFNLNANTPGKYLLPAVQGTMDVTNQWPLAEQFKNFDFNAPGGGGQVDTTISQPPSGFHELVVNCWFTTNPTGSPRTVELQKAFTNLPVAQNNVPLLHVDMTAAGFTLQAALIGGAVFQNIPIATSSNIYQTGLKAVYVPFPQKLFVRYTTPAADVCTLRTISLRLPGSQPFVSLFNLL